MTVKHKKVWYLQVCHNAAYMSQTHDLLTGQLIGWDCLCIFFRNDHDLLYDRPRYASQSLGHDQVLILRQKSWPWDRTYGPETKF